MPSKMLQENTKGAAEENGSCQPRRKYPYFRYIAIPYGWYVSGRLPHRAPQQDKSTMGVSHMLERVLHVISKPEAQRGRSEIDILLPWLRKRSNLFRNLEKEVLITLIRRCDYAMAVRDDVILRQGDIGQCFYVMLTGKTSVYIDTVKSDEDGKSAEEHSQEGGTPQGEGGEDKGSEEGEPREAEQELLEELEEERKKRETGGYKKKGLDRSQFGKFIICFEAGQSFGEIALMTKEAVRNASIIADEDTDLLVIHRELFNGTLKAKQEEEYAERHAFIKSCSLFHHWTPKFKRLLEMSIRKETFLFDSMLVRQGEPLLGLHFIIKGQAKLMVDPATHKTQYPRLFDGSNNVLAKELGKTFKRKEERVRESSLNEQIRVRRREGYAAAERRLAQKSMTLCFVDESEVIGAAELVLGLETYTHSVKCTANTEVFILDNKNIERLILKKNPHTLELLRQGVEHKLAARLYSPLSGHIQLYQHLLDKAREMRPRRPATAHAPKKEAVETVTQEKDESSKDKEAMFSQMVKLYMENKAPLVQSSVPGSVYYVVKSRERAKKEMAANLSRRTAPGKPVSMEMRLQKARKLASQRRQPRSRRELEKLTIGSDSEQMRSLQDQNHAVNRFLAQKPGIRPRPATASNGRPSTALGHSTATASSEKIFRLTEPELGSGDPDEQILLRPDHMQHDSIRDVVLEMGDLHNASNASRARIICSMIERSQNQNPAALQTLLRPKSAPVRKFKAEPSEYAGADSDSESDVGEFDYETSEPALQDLEAKIRDFHNKHDKQGGQRVPMQVPGLKRFNIQSPDDVPVPGGTVYVRQKTCQYPAGTYVNPSHHMHVRRFIVPKNAYALATKSMSAFEHMAMSAISDDLGNGNRSMSRSDSSNGRRGSNLMKTRAQSAPARGKPSRPESTKSVAWS